jgi:uncharacterized protein
MSSNQPQPAPEWPAPGPAPSEPLEALPAADSGFVASAGRRQAGPQERRHTGPQDGFRTGPQDRVPATGPQDRVPATGPQDRVPATPGHWPATRAPWPGPAMAQPAGRPAAGTGEQPTAGTEEPGAAAARPGPADPGDERLATLSYLGVPFLGPLVPLAIYLVRGRAPGYVRSHSAQALNLSVTALLYSVCVLILFAMLALDSVVVALVIAVPLAVALWLTTLAFVMVAASRANRGDYYLIPGWLCASIVH